MNISFRIFFILSAFSENTLKVLKHLWRIRGKYLGVFGDYAKSMENTKNLGLFAVHEIGAFNFPTICLTIILE